VDFTKVRTGRNRFAKVDAMLLTHRGHVDAYLLDVPVTRASRDWLAGLATKSIVMDQTSR
jgi:hypothetical protein